MFNFLRVTCFVAILLIAAPAAMGTTWYVATTGDDGWPGSDDQPFLTIARGVDAAANGDTVLIHDGTYTGPGNRDIEISGKGLTIASVSGDPELCVIDAERDTSGSGWILRWIWGPWEFSLEGLTLTRAAVGGVDMENAPPIRMTNCNIDSTGIGAYVSGIQADGCRFRACETGLYVSFNLSTIENSLFEDCDIGIEVVVNDSVRLVNCEIRNNRVGAYTRHWGFDFVDCLFSGNETGILGGFFNTIRRCELREHARAAIDMPGGGQIGGMQVQSSLIHHNPGTGILVESHPLRVTGTTISHNGAGIISTHDYESDVEITTTIIAFNTGEALADAGAIYTNCDVYGNGPDLAPDSWVPWVDGNLELDPLFCYPDDGNYHVSGLSPCSDDDGNAVIGAFGVGCDDAVAIDDIALLARWTDDGVEVTWNGRSRAFSRGADLVRLDETSNRTTVLETWSGDSFPGSGRYLDLTAQPWQSYTYSMVGLDDGGTASTEARLESRTSLPSVSRIGRIYPNPSNPKATIEYVLVRDEKVQLEIYDLAGRRIYERNLGVVAAGPGEFVWGGTDNAGRGVSAGSYVVRLVTGTTSDTSRLVIVK